LKTLKLTLTDYPIIGDIKDLQIGKNEVKALVLKHKKAIVADNNFIPTLLAQFIQEEKI